LRLERRPRSGTLLDAMAVDGERMGCCGSLLFSLSDQRKEVVGRKWSKEMLWEVVLSCKARQGDAMLIASSVLRRFHYHDAPT
jgi:hypothetical protein